jgi:CspA family cold shock protein
MLNGTVKFFNAAKKFGFVAPDDGGKDVFVPIASVTASGVSVLIAGQRVSFETAPDSRGPKAVNLKLVDAPVLAPKTDKIIPGARGGSSTPQLTFYYDPASEIATEMLVALGKSGFDPRVVDYVAAPPSVDELKKLSMHLHVGSLVRRYDPLFHDLRLDDRFIDQTAFWDGIFENPILIKGPILATANRTCICRSDAVVTEFLESIFPNHARPALEIRALPERTATPALEIVALKPVVASVKTVALELRTMEPLAPTADLPAKRAQKGPPKKKVAGSKTAATKASKKTVRKPVPKLARTKAK